MHYYKRHIGDYAKKAGKLSMLQHGAYTMLLDAYYDTERPPTKAIAIEWCWAFSAEELAAIEFVLARFFKLDGEVYRQESCDKDIAAYHNNSATNKQIALDREAKKRERKARTVHEPFTSEHEPAPNHKPLTINHKPYKYLPDDLAIAGQMAEKILLITKSTKPPNLESWANSIRMMREIDNRLPDQIRSVFLWANRDSFWKANILSAPTLREKFDKLFAKMNSETGNGQTGNGGTSNPRQDTSAAGRVRANIARDRAADRANPLAMADDVVHVRPQVGGQLRSGGGPGQGVGELFEGDYVRTG